MVFCIDYNTPVLSAESSCWCTGARSSQEESKMAVADECLDLRRCLCRSRSCPRPSSEELGHSLVWLGLGTPGPGALCSSGTPGTRPKVIATNPGYATAGVERGDHCMILHNRLHRIPEDHRCSSCATAHL